MKLVIPPIAFAAFISCNTIQAGSDTSTIDLKKHRASLRFADGSTKQIDVRPDVDFTKRKVGEKVVIQTTETFAVLIENP